MKATSLKDKEVLGEAGHLIGKVKDANIDDKTWAITTLEVELTGDTAKELHLKKTFGSTSVPVSTNVIGAVGDKVMLKTSTEELGKSLNSQTVNP